MQCMANMMPILVTSYDTHGTGRRYSSLKEGPHACKGQYWHKCATSIGHELFYFPKYTYMLSEQADTKVANVIYSRGCPNFYKVMFSYCVHFVTLLVCSYCYSLIQSSKNTNVYII
jgi:hypothetical protein